jgi:hypothetical protein
MQTINSWYFPSKQAILPCTIVTTTVQPSYGQLGISSPPTCPVQRLLYVRPHHRYVPRKTRDRSEEIPKEHEYPVKLNKEADQRPP